MEQRKEGTTEGGSASENNGVLVGLKPFMNYVTAVVMQFTTKNAESVTLKARGKFISKAVDVAEISTKRFLEGQAEIKSIITNSEDFKNREGRDIRVSTIEITLARKSI